jgi:PAS domain S-box-containing protein
MNDNKENNSPAKTADKTSKFPQRAATRNIIIRTVLVLLTCFVTTYLIWNYANTNAQKELRSYFEFRVREVNQLLVQRLANYEQVLRSERGLFNTSDNVNRAEFHTFFNSLHLDKNYPGIQGVGFSLIIPPKQIKKHIASVRAEGFSDYKIWPEGTRETYTSIIYLEPFSDLNLRAFGYDMFSEPVRRKAMESARDSDESKISGKITLVQETGKEKQAGFLMYLPVYRKGTSHKTLQERRANIIGWVYSPFRMDDFMTGLLGERSADLDLEIYDGNKISNETKMYDSKTSTLRFNHLLNLSKEIEFDGHKWTVIIKSTPELESRIGFNSSLIILIAGLVLSLLIAIITWGIEKKRLFKRFSVNKLRESETRFKQISEGTEEWIWEVDTNGVFTYMNPYVKKLLGYNPDELIGIKHFYDFFEPEHKEELIQGALEAFGRKESIRNFINCNIHKDGRRIILSTSGFPILDSENNFIGYRGINVDITNRQKAEAELKISEMKFRNIAEGTKAILFNVNTHGIFTYLNEAACKKLEMTNQELLGKLYLRFVHPENREKVHSIFSEQMKNPTLNKSIDVQIITKSGKEGWISFLINPIYLEGKIAGLSSIGQDITERKLAEAELGENERKTRALLDAIPDMIFRINREGTFLDYKADRLDLYAQSEETIIGKQYRDITPPEFADLADRYIKQTLNSGEIQEFEYQMSTPNRGLRDYEARMVASGKDEVIAVVRDITDRKFAELNLKESEGKYRTLFENIPIGIGITDLTGKLIAFNDSILEPGGYSRNDLIRTGTVENLYYNLSDRETLIPLLKEKGSITQHPIKLKRKDGSPYDALLSLSIIYINDQPMIQAVVEDITERKRAEDSLKFFRMMIDKSQDTIELIDVETARFIDVNEKACADLGYSRSELLNMCVFDIDPNQNMHDFQQMIQTIGQSNSMTVESLHQRKDGSTFPVEVNIAVVKLEKTYTIAIVRDITEKKIAENKLKKSEDQLKEAQQVGHIGSWEVDPVKNIGTMSDEMYKIFDLNNSIDVTIDTFLETPIPEDRKMVRELIMKSLETREGINFDFRTFTSSGDIRWIHERSTVEVDDKGNLKRVFGTCQNVTDRKLAELNLKESEARLTDAMKIAKLSTWEYNFALDRFTFPDQSFSLFNTTAEHEGGYTMSSEHFAQKYIYPDDRALIEKEIRKAFETPDPAYTSYMEYRVIYAPGEIGYFAANVRIEKDADNRTIKALGVNQDITKRKRAEDSLKFFRMMIDKSQDAIEVIDVETARFIDVNEKACTELGYSRDELLNMSVFDIDPNQNMNDFQQMIQNIGQSDSMTVESLHKRKDGSFFPVEINIAIVRLEKTYTIAIVREITERKLVEEEIKRSNEQLKKLNAEKDKFFSIIAHDLKSPFNGFIGLTALMADRTEEFSKDECIENGLLLNKSARNLYKLLENLLEWSQMQKGSISFDPKEINLSTIISQNIETITQRALQKGITILNEIPEAERVYADNDMLNSVMRNLISNSVKFTKRDGKVIIASKMIEGKMLEISVSDTGMGISANDVNRLFKIEEKVSSKGTDGESSTGLGLLLCKEFVEMHGGKIRVESEEGKGSTFYFTLPSYP